MVSADHPSWICRHGDSLRVTLVMMTMMNQSKIVGMLARSYTNVGTVGMAVSWGDRTVARLT